MTKQPLSPEAVDALIKLHWRDLLVVARCYEDEERTTILEAYDKANTIKKETGSSISYFMTEVADGFRHRLAGPAHIYTKSGENEETVVQWYMGGKLHNPFGPALTEHVCGKLKTLEYYLDGVAQKHPEDEPERPEDGLVYDKEP